MTEWVDPYPDQAGCMWAKQRAKEMRDFIKRGLVYEPPKDDSIIKTEDNA